MHRATVGDLARCCPVWDHRGWRIPKLGVPSANSTAAELIWTVLEARGVLGFSPQSFWTPVGKAAWFPVSLCSTLQLWENLSELVLEQVHGSLLNNPHELPAQLWRQTNKGLALHNPKPVPKASTKQKGWTNTQESCPRQRLKDCPQSHSAYSNLGQPCFHAQQSSDCNWLLFI